MALYVVKARPKNDLSGLRKESNSGEISRLRPFGKTLQNGLDNAKIDPKDGYALWIEEDYCTPPLAWKEKVFLIGILMISQFNLLPQKKKDRIELPIFLDFGLNRKMYD
jgi:hypothetical protein